MDKLNDFYNYLKDRLSNNFIFSFVVSWFIFNWKIILGLFWMDKTDFQSEGYKSVLRYVEFHLDFNNSFLWPLLFGAGYAFVLKNILSATQTATLKWGESLNLWIAKGGSIPTEKYLILRDDYKSLIERLTTVLKEESKTAGDVSEANMKYLTEFHDKLQAQKKLEEVTTSTSKQVREFQEEIGKFFNVKFLDGTWSVQYKNTDGNLLEKTFLDIRDGRMSIMDGNRRTDIYTIGDFSYNVRSKQIYFNKYPIPRNESNDQYQFRIVNLTVHDENTLVGAEDRINYVKYVRQP